MLQRKLQIVGATQNYNINLQAKSTSEIDHLQTLLQVTTASYNYKFQLQLQLQVTTTSYNILRDTHLKLHFTNFETKASYSLKLWGGIYKTSYNLLTIIMGRRYSNARVMLTFLIKVVSLRHFCFKKNLKVILRRFVNTNHVSLLHKNFSFQVDYLYFSLRPGACTIKLFTAAIYGFS